MPFQEKKKKRTGITPGIDFNNFITYDEELSTCTTKQNEIVELSESINSNPDDTEIKTPKPTSFLNALHGLESPKKCSIV